VKAITGVSIIFSFKRLILIEELISISKVCACYKRNPSLEIREIEKIANRRRMLIVNRFFYALQLTVRKLALVCGLVGTDFGLNKGNH
jgi:hypothetical protein